MSFDVCLTRMRKVHEDLVTVNSFHKLSDMSGKKGKPCRCTHHRSTSGSASRSRPEKRGCRGADKNARCPERPRPTICLCSQSDSESKCNRRSRDRRGSQLPFEETGTSGDGNEQSDRAEGVKRAAVAIQTNDPGGRMKAEDIEQMYKDLECQRRRNLELEEKLEEMRCCVKCLKDEAEQRTNCLRDSLEKEKSRASLAARSRNLAMDLAKQSRDHTDLVKASRDDVLKRINDVKGDNSRLQCECQELRNKLLSISENEAKMYAEVDDKVNKMRCAAKQKEMALASEKSELEKTVSELASHVNIQKERICELKSICAKQREALQNSENCVSSKVAQLSKAESKIQSMDCECRKLREEMDGLKCCLKRETEARENMQAEYDERRDNCNCELQIKDKIIADQVETIKKLRKLLQDSEKMAHQAAREFESLRSELHCLKQSNRSLRAALEDAEAQLASGGDSDCCERCRILEKRVDDLAEQKRKTLAAAKFAAEKLRNTTAEYQRLLDAEKKQHRYVADLVHQKETEIDLLKRELLHHETFRCGRTDDYYVVP